MKKASFYNQQQIIICGGEPSFISGWFVSLLILLVPSELHILVEVGILMNWIKLSVEQLLFWTGLYNVVHSLFWVAIVICCRVSQIPALHGCSKLDHTHSNIV